MRRTARGHGFLLCLLLNMLFRFEWCAAAIVYYGVHRFFSFPLFPVFILLGIWVLYALFVTVVLSLANRSGNAPVPRTQNKNPYSKKTQDFLPPRDA
ncbi:MAG: hypothetical protein ACI4I5_10005 [Acutalibacteraceae bacterium]